MVSSISCRRIIKLIRRYRPNIVVIRSLQRYYKRRIKFSIFIKKNCDFNQQKLVFIKLLDYFCVKLLMIYCYETRKQHYYHVARDDHHGGLDFNR